MPSTTAERVALAIALSNSMSGQSYDVETPESAEVRAANMLRSRDCYGRAHTYIVEGDPSGWCSTGGALATVFMEPLGVSGDCEVPLDYYNGGFETSMKASALLGDVYIEFVNAAVALVYPA